MSRNRGKYEKNGIYLKDNGIWQIDTTIPGYGRLCCSSGSREKQVAEAIRDAEIDRIETLIANGPLVEWLVAATKYLEDFQHKASIGRDAQCLEAVNPFIQHLYLNQVNNDSLKPYRKARRAAGVKSDSVNREQAVVRRILTLSARLWRHEDGRPWLATEPPLIPQVDWHDARQPYPISWSEQTELMKQLPAHLYRPALFITNTSLRPGETAGLRWKWQVSAPGIDNALFMIPGEFTKNGNDKLVVCNSVATSIIRQCEMLRVSEPTAEEMATEDYSEDLHGHFFVFTYKRSRIKQLSTDAWRKARGRAGLKFLRVHDLRHTAGRRLRAAGIPEETRREIFGHSSGSVTTDYSQAEIREYIEVMEKIARRGEDSPTLFGLRGGKDSRIFPAA